MTRPLPDQTARLLDLKVAAKQADWRSAGVAAAVERDGKQLWHGAFGTTDGDDPHTLPTPDTQFRMGSITKTFTAVLVLQTRDDGLLALDDTLEHHLPGTVHGGLTLRRMLSHLSGLQREPVGEVWERPEGPQLDELLSGLKSAEAVLPPARRHHYSNLAFALLGEVVARVRGRSWEESLQERILDPLELRRTTTRRTPPFARGYLTDPYADRLHEEPEFPGNAFAPAAELWSTVTDLGRWAAFIADPEGAGAGVLSADTMDEMCHPQVMYDLDTWNLAWGLGFMLHRRGERVLVGHDGAMPGFLAGLAVRRPEKVGAVVLANTSAAADPGGLAVDLVLAVVEADPDVAETWRPGPPVPPEVEELLGQWWSEGTPYAFSARAGKLEIRPVGAPRTQEPSVLEQEGVDLFRTVSGRSLGERLRVVRGQDGGVTKLYWATYPVTRGPLPFGV